MSKPIIYKFNRYRHRRTPPLCRNCREKRSSEVTANGPLACLVDQNTVDVFIRDNFDVRSEKELIEVLKESPMQNNKAPEYCCSKPVCKNWGCMLCEYGEDCEGDQQKIDYCPRPHECPDCGASCLQCELWLKPVYFKNSFSAMTEGEALRSIGVQAVERDGEKGLLLPSRDGGEPIFIPASNEKPDAIIASERDEDRVQGSIQVDCSGCKQKIWLSPSSQEMLKQYPDTPVYCIPCFVKEKDIDIPAEEMQEWIGEAKEIENG